MILGFLMKIRLYLQEDKAPVIIPPKKTGTRRTSANTTTSRSTLGCPTVANEDTHTVFIKMLTSETIEVDVTRSMTVLQLKEKIASIPEDKGGVAVDQQRLIFHGKQLEDERCLGEYSEDINEITIHLVLRLKGC